MVRQGSVHYNASKNKLYHFLLRVALLIGLTLIFWLLSWLVGPLFGCSHLFQAHCMKIGLATGGRAFASALSFCGLPGVLSSVVRILITWYGGSEILGSLHVMPEGSDSEGKAQGPEHGETEPSLGKRNRDTDPEEGVGPSSTRQRLGSANAPQAGDNPVGLESAAPSIEDLKTKILDTFRSVGKDGRKPASKFLERIHTGIGLREADPEKRLKIEQLLQELYIERQIWDHSARAASVDFMVKLSDWERKRGWFYR
jgi:hypothetical protein